MHFAPLELPEFPTVAQNFNHDAELADPQAEGSESPISRHSSIKGPYREATVPTTFARCNIVSSVSGAGESYSRSLLSSGHGYPLWEVVGNWNRPKKHFEQGVSIGDVGVLDPEGDFIFSFNIFSPPTDPVHDGFTLPSGFEEMDRPLPSDIEYNQNHFSPGSVISSPGIDVNRVSSDPLEITFSTSAREGGVLILPDGASREDLISTSQLTNYVKEHALDWYHHVCNHSLSSAMVANGSLYLVTGCDKAKSWSVVSIPRYASHSGDRIEMRYQYRNSPPWDNKDRARTSSLSLAEAGNRNHAVFVRGLKISLSNRLWTNHLPHVPPENAAYYNLMSTPILGFRSRLVRLKERLFGASDNAIENRSNVPFHPSIIIAQVLLEESPTADIVMVDDLIWRNVIDGSDTTLPNIIHLITRAIESCDVVTHGKLATLVPKTVSSNTGPSPKPQNNAVRNFLGKRADKFAQTTVSRKIKKIIKS